MSGDPSEGHAGWLAGGRPMSLAPHFFPLLAILLTPASLSYQRDGHRFVKVCGTWEGFHRPVASVYVISIVTTQVVYRPSCTWPPLYKVVPVSASGILRSNP